MPEKRDNEEKVLEEPPPPYRVTASEAGDVELSMLADSLAMTPWERMQANDDILNFGETLRTAMQKRNAKSQ